MIENRFRGKRVDNEEWVFGCYCFNPLLNRAEIFSFDNERSYVCEIYPTTVGQYTGKTVKTGPVYQDDIGKSIDGLFLVVWDKEKAAFMMQFLGGSGERLYLEEMWEDSEIIGNIFDNPELLEVGHEL